MEAKEYKKAAKRHLNTCNILLEKMNTQRNEHTKRELLLNFYYLSGYVVECMLKYGICAETEWEGEVENFNFDKFTYERHLQTHKLTDLIETYKQIKKNVNDENFRLTIAEKPVRKLIQKWDVDRRYLSDTRELDTDVVMRYFKTIEIFHNNLSKIH
jgi:hypothetical protein